MSHIINLVFLLFISVLTATVAHSKNIWESIYHVYMEPNESSSADTIKMVEDIDDKEKFFVTERFSTDLFNRFTDLGGDQNLIIDKKEEKVFLFNNDDDIAYELDLHDYLENYLPDMTIEKVAPDLQIENASVGEMLGFSLLKATYTVPKNEDLPWVETSTVSVLFSPELPYDFYYPALVSLPGYPLHKIVKTSLDDDGFDIHYKAISVELIDEESLISRPPEQYEIIVAKASGPGQIESVEELNRQSETKTYRDNVILQLTNQSQSVSRLGPFQNGVAQVSDGETKFYINVDGKRVFDNLIFEIEEDGSDLILVAIKDSKIGFYSPEEKTWLIEPSFEFLDNATNNLYKAYTAAGYGYVDKKGSLLVPAKYDEVYILDGHNYFAVKRGNVWGIYSAKQQKLVTEPKYEAIDYCGGCGNKANYFYAKNKGKWGVLRLDGQVLLPFEYDHPDHSHMRSDNWVINLEKNGEVLAINLKTGQEFLAEDYDSIDLMYGFLKLKRGNRYAIINSDGKQITGFDYDSIEPVYSIDNKDKYIAVANERGRAVIDQEGELVIPFSNLETFHLKPEKYFIVRRNDKVGLYNLQGKEVLPVSFDAIITDMMLLRHGPLEGEPMFKLEKDNRYGWYFPKYSSVIYPEFNDVSLFYDSNGEHYYIRVKHEDRMGLYDLQGNEILEMDNYEFISFVTPDLLRVTKGSMSGLFDIHKKEYLLPVNYRSIVNSRVSSKYLEVLESNASDDAQRLWWNITTEGFTDLPYEKYSLAYEESLWVVKQDDFYYLYDINSQQIISEPYDWISPFNKGMAQVVLGDFYGYINTSGKENFPPIYNDVETTEDGFVILYGVDGKRGWQELWADPNEIITTAKESDGKNILPYDTFEPLQNGLGYLFKQDGFFGLLDSNGNTIFPAVLDNLYINHFGLEFPLIARIKEKYFYINSKGDVLPIVAESIL